MQLKGMTVIFALGLGLASAAEENGTATACNNSTLKGDYGLLLSGVRPTPGGPEQFVGTVIRRFDGNGSFTQVGNVHGAVSGWVADQHGSGTYSVNPDCTGIVKLTIQGAPTQPAERIVIVDDSEGIFAATAQPAALMATSQARKMSSGRSRQERDQQSDLVEQLVKNITQRLGLAIPR